MCNIQLFIGILLLFVFTHLISNSSISYLSGPIANPLKSANLRYYVMFVCTHMIQWFRCKNDDIYSFWFLCNNVINLFRANASSTKEITVVISYNPSSSSHDGGCSNLQGTGFEFHACEWTNFLNYILDSCPHLDQVTTYKYCPFSILLFLNF